MNDQQIEALIAQTNELGLDKLRGLWRKRYGFPPRLQSIPIMRMMIAWRIQAEAFGGLDKDTRKALAKSGPPRAEGLQLGNGTKLTRNWKGTQIEVIVEEDGFRWRDEVFPSLSAAATAIAGSKWNGPRFFGLRNAS